ncbi:MAG TPA: dihydrofolate reductase [Anaerolineales bacterium]|nr:dihydrofolate reductase [Anaerolineales bacterium]
MHISLIVAMDRNRGIGKNNCIPWRLSADLKNFKTLTMGHHLIVGRKTAASIGRPLPGRTGVLITRTGGYNLPGWDTVYSLEDALALARQREETEVFIGGGADIYALSLPLADRIYLTHVHATVEADTFFPKFDEMVWQVVESWDHPADERNEFSFTYQVLARKGA